MKTLADCTVDDIGEFVEAAQELLSMAMFHYWESGGDAPDADEDDRGRREVIEKMRAAFIRLGLESKSYEQFRADLETLLRSGRPPEAQRPQE